MDSEKATILRQALCICLHIRDNESIDSSWCHGYITCLLTLGKITDDEWSALAMAIESFEQ